MYFLFGSVGDPELILALVAIKSESFFWRVHKCFFEIFLTDGAYAWAQINSVEFAESFVADINRQT